MLKLLVVHAYTACLAPEIKPFIIPQPVSSTRRAYWEGGIDNVLFPLMSHLEEKKRGMILTSVIMWEICYEITSLVCSHVIHKPSFCDCNIWVLKAWNERT